MGISSEALRCPRPWPAPSDGSALGASNQGEKNLASALSLDVCEWGVGDGIPPPWETPVTMATTLPF